MPQLLTKNNLCPTAYSIVLDFAFVGLTLSSASAISSGRSLIWIKSGAARMALCLSWKENATSMSFLPDSDFLY
jgi:hypothetical protein